MPNDNNKTSTDQHVGHIPATGGPEENNLDLEEPLKNNSIMEIFEGACSESMSYRESAGVI